MYAHRTEDVVNFGSNPQGRVAGICKSVSMDLSEKNTTNPKKRKLSAPDLFNNTTECSSKLEKLKVKGLEVAGQKARGTVGCEIEKNEEKQSQYGLLAQCKGMEKLGFRK
ncbi:hypothetical protein AMTRI_Chr02g213920 [Amborella trichopoda]|uniref:Uncharacterized protein n=2 Tax=Amborella trichopoda TaxID=13333 RepID=U5CYG3_AMBTC|nr:hypothetical protein AMTR_s00032p00230110 [Amborella trichopoda]